MAYSDGQLNKNVIRNLVELISNHKETVIWDDAGYPNIMLVYKKFNLTYDDGTIRSTVHPAFVVDGDEVDEIYVAKYRTAITKDGIPVSLPNGFPDLIKFTSSDTMASKLQEKRTEIATKKGSGWKITNCLERGLLKYSYLNERRFVPSKNSRINFNHDKTLDDPESILNENLKFRNLSQYNQEEPDYLTTLLTQSEDERYGLKHPEETDGYVVLVAYINYQGTNQDIHFNTLSFDSTAPVSTGDILLTVVGDIPVYEVIAYKEYRNNNISFPIRSDMDTDVIRCNFILKPLVENHKELLEDSVINAEHGFIWLKNQTKNNLLNISGDWEYNSETVFMNIDRFYCKPSKTGFTIKHSDELDTYFHKPKDLYSNVLELTDGFWFKLSGGVSSNLVVNMMVTNTRNATAPTLVTTSFIAKIGQFTNSDPIESSYATYPIQAFSLAHSGSGSQSFNRTLTGVSNPSLSYPYGAINIHEFYFQIFDGSLANESLTNKAALVASYFPYRNVDITKPLGNILETYDIAESERLIGGNPTYPPVTVNTNAIGSSIPVSSSIMAHTSPLGITWVNATGGEELYNQFLKFTSQGIRSVDPNDIIETENDGEPITDPNLLIGRYEKPNWHGYRLTYIPPAS